MPKDMNTITGWNIDSKFPVVAVNLHDSYCVECDTEVLIKQGLVIKWTVEEKFMVYCVSCGNTRINKVKK